MTTASSIETPAGALAERLFDDALGVGRVCVYVGDRLGLYRVLADAGPSTAGELAAAAGVHPRYARGCVERRP